MRTSIDLRDYLYLKHELFTDDFCVVDKYFIEQMSIRRIAAYTHLPKKLVFQIIDLAYGELEKRLEEKT